MFDPFLTEKQILRKLGGDKNRYSMTFDGNTEGKVMIPLVNGVSFVKVSNKVLSKEELMGATYVSFDGKTIVIAEKNIIDNSAVGATTQFYGVMADNMTDAPTIVSCKACTINFGGVPVTVPSDGTYFIYMMMGSAMYVSSLSKETIVPIDQKYLHKEINLADYGIDLLAVANSGQNQVTFEAPGLRDAIGDGTNVIFVNPSENLTLMARPTLIMRGDGFVRFQISIDFADDNSKTVIKMVFILGFGDAFADMLIIDLFT